MKKHYQIKFLFHTDLRKCVDVYTHNEISALAIAMEEISNGGWVEKGFTIEIVSQDNKN